MLKSNIRGNDLENHILEKYIKPMMVKMRKSNPPYKFIYSFPELVFESQRIEAENFIIKTMNDNCYDVTVRHVPSRMIEFMIVPGGKEN